MSCIGVGIESSQLITVEVLLEVEEEEDDGYRFLENMQKQPNTPEYGGFRNWYDAWRPKINVCRHFKIQDGGFQFLETMEKQLNSSEYGYFRSWMALRGWKSMFGAILNSQLVASGF